MTHPTDALRLVPTKATPHMIAAMDRNIFGQKMGLGSDFLHGLWENALKAAPASPLPEGGGMRPDRIAELPDFLVALFDEWGEEDHAQAAKQIVTFLTDSEGLERYRESYGLPAAPTGAK